MSFIDINIADAVELEAVPEGEYQVRCTEAETKQGNKGQFILLRLDIPSEQFSKGVTDVLMLPTPNDEPKQANARKLAIRRACEAFGVEFAGGFDVKDFTGREAYAFLTVEESDQYGRQNRVRRYVTGA